MIFAPIILNLGALRISVKLLFSCGLVKIRTGRILTNIWFDSFINVLNVLFELLWSKPLPLFEVDCIFLKDIAIDIIKQGVPGAIFLSKNVYPLSYMHLFNFTLQLLDIANTFSPHEVNWKRVDWILERNSLQWGWWGTWTSCQEKLWQLHLWKCSRRGWMQF